MEQTCCLHNPNGGRSIDINTGEAGIWEKQDGRADNFLSSFLSFFPLFLFLFPFSVCWPVPSLFAVVPFVSHRRAEFLCRDK